MDYATYIFWGKFGLEQRLIGIFYRLEFSAKLIGLRQQISKNVAVNICQSEIPALVTICQTLVIHP